MKIVIDDDYADAILVGNLAESYISIKEMMKQPTQWHEDDVAAWKELIPAIELVGNWYCTDFKSVVKAAKKKK